MKDYHEWMEAHWIQEKLGEAQDWGREKHLKTESSSAPSPPGRMTLSF